MQYVEIKNLIINAYQQKNHDKTIFEFISVLLLKYPNKGMLYFKVLV